LAPVPVPTRVLEPPSPRPLLPVPFVSPSVSPELRPLSIAVVTAQTREDAARDVLAEASTPQERVRAEAEVASATQVRQEAEAALADVSTSTDVTQPGSVPPPSSPTSSSPSTTGPTSAAVAAPSPAQTPDRSTRAASNVSDAGAGRGQLAALIAGIAVLLVIIVRELAR